MGRVLGIGEKFPEFSKKAVVSLEFNKEFQDLTNDYFKDKWAVMFWYPKDFTFVCPTEITAFSNANSEFENRNSKLIAASTDSEFVHLGWRTHHPELKNLSIPMLADTSKSLAEELGILEPNEKIAYRATFIVDPKGIIRWVSVNDLPVGRNVQEVLRILDALQSGGLTPCDWKKGEDTL